MELKDLEGMLPKYIGGQIEVQNKVEEYLHRGEIEEIKLYSTKEGTPVLSVKLKWVAKGVGYPKGIKKWVALGEKFLTYEVPIDNFFYTIFECGEERICLSSWITHEFTVLFPKDYESRLDPSKVEGLEDKLL